ncbi:hypothetical protein FCM35_KLT07394 [Carex littledalei]|uniref:Uncharacterized protein n=1 Tax=Carex littledalei TaxID=544730 RepID=A0A833QZE3_9POAL|nr:hypothetical protein FCM35_KLT07394 [Carex littledalei]
MFDWMSLDLATKQARLALSRAVKLSSRFEFDAFDNELKPAQNSTEVSNIKEDLILWRVIMGGENIMDGDGVICCLMLMRGVEKMKFLILEKSRSLELEN